MTQNGLVRHLRLDRILGDIGRNRGLRIVKFTWTYSRLIVEDSHEPQLKVKDENVGWKHTCSRCSHAGFERIGSRSGYNPVEDIYILQRPSSCDPHFRYSEIPAQAAGKKNRALLNC
jgi:hypothetical protein